MAKPSQKLGILGGGQLAQMLGQAADRLGISWSVSTSSSNDPAAKIAKSVFDQTPNGLHDFLGQIDRLTFESEFFNTQSIQKLLPKDLIVFPPVEGMKHLQNKFEQKKLLKKLGIPTAEFELFDGKFDPLKEKWPEGFVIKWAELGYDGKGTHFFQSEETAKPFIKEAHAKGVQCYVERKIAFQKELAWIGCRDQKGQTQSWPVVISHQENGICKAVWGPAALFGLDQSLENEIQNYGKLLLEHLNWVGVLAIELFMTSDRKVLVNELAPRVHNSGHWTQHFSKTSQFENHIRAVCDLPLGVTSPTAPCFLMWNLLGPMTCTEPCLPPPPEKSHWVWYEKNDLKLGRKMGHINLQLESPKALESKLSELKKWDRQWLENIRNHTSLS